MIRVQTIWLQTAKRYIPLCCCFMLSITVHAQFSPYNLVPNYSFEQYTNCPSGGSLSEVKNSKPDIWYKPDYKFAAYLIVVQAACALSYISQGINFQYPRTGWHILVCFITMEVMPGIIFK
jgi:hypothetical protein